MKKIRKGDEVIVIAGKDKGKIGEILQIVGDDKVIIAGINIAKKHTKPNPNKNITGGVLDKAMPIHISNIAIYNSESKKRDRVGFKIEDGEKIRIFKSSQKAVD